MPRQLPELDGLRGILALWVFAGHVLLALGLQHAPHLELIGAGEIPVTVFMMLSGFAIAASLQRTSQRYAPYLLRRICRLYPAYLLSLALAAGVALLVTTTSGHDPFFTAKTAHDWAVIHTSESEHPGAHILVHLLLLHGAVPDAWLPGTAMSLNGPAWSLSLEWQFYLVAPLLLLAFSKTKAWPVGMALVGAICLAGALPVLRDAYPAVPSFLPMATGYFLIGMATAKWFSTVERRPNLVALAAAAVGTIEIVRGDLAIALSLAIWSATMVVAMSAIRGPIGAVLTWRPLAAFGERSYGFYLFHVPVLAAVGLGLVHAGWAGDREIYGLGLLLAFPITDGLARLSWGFIERPVLSWGKRRIAGAGRSPAPVGAEAIAA